jgi:secretion/DNA translocation related TadE-like protein
VRAADLAALAGAQHSLTDREVACRVAQQVARANGAELENCWLEADALRVQVMVASMQLMPTVRAMARAGPAPN